MPEVSRYSVVVIGSSLGGVEALQVVLGSLRTTPSAAILVVHHISPAASRLASVLERVSPLPVSWAADGAPILPGRVYLCPARSSMRLEPDATLSVRPHGRPSSLGSVDELFTSAADAFGAGVLALVLTGSGHDGSVGAQSVKEAGGTVLVQDEVTSLAYGMPGAVAGAGLADLVLALGEIPEILDAVVGRGERLPLPQVLAAEAVFAAGGEMGRRMAAMNWSSTSLGPLEKWPEVLRNTVALVLAAQVPMDLLWGRDMVQFYNDACRDLAGDQHPAMLGQPVLATWAASAQFGPTLDEVWRSGRGRLLRDQAFTIDRRGVPELVYATADYSPVRDGGRVVGILATLIETTGQVVANRRLRLLQRLATATADDPDNEQVACERMADTLAGSRQDIPFALVYLPDRTGAELHLAAAAGVRPGSGVAERRLSLRDSVSWPVAGVLRERRAMLVDDLDTRFHGWMPGEDRVLPARAMMIPAGRRDDGMVAAVVILGVEPLVPFDDDHRAFLDLVAEQVGVAVLAGRRRRDMQERMTALAALNRSKDEFFASVSHEFRTPLTLLLLPLEQLLSSRLTPEQTEAVQLAHRNALRSLKLVSTLLEFARIGEGATRARYEDVDLAELTADIASVFRSAVQHAGLAYVVDCPPLGRTVPVDPDMWEQVVLNLVANALKHTFTGSITITVGLRANHAELRVADTGVGIAADEIPHLFQRFHRIRGTLARSHEGSGIGLALVQELVRLHRGSVRVRSTPGKGTTFTVWLPLAQRRTSHVGAGTGTGPRPSRRQAFADEARLWLTGGETTPAEIQDAPAPETVLPGRRPVVLLVDDNPDLRAYLRRLLDDRYEVAAAPDGVHALKVLAARQVDLVLTDTMMPRLDGLALLAAIRTDPALRHVPVIVLTAVADPDAAVAALAAGAHDYVVKPFTARELVARIEAQLALARGRAERTAPDDRIYPR
ncbi:chemotaxis protein CheB [Actinoplanes sp. RD1]|uniref:chemotaxis protein CheB n=1 Tax=Actinoplanes sp. RD1 TaxID=3064538 RepID=UPI0027413D46|nr:chemotaxis protein CheB [Actinoplanes sp. RD1]